jgi:hypothetical protein
MTWATRFILGLALVVFAAAGAAYWYDQTEHPPFVVEPGELEVGTFPPGDHILTLRVTNPASVPRRILDVPDG